MASEVSNLPRFNLNSGDGKSEEKGKLWKQRWESYTIFTGLQNEDASKQVSALIMSLTSDALRVYYALPLSVHHRKDI